MIGLKFINWLNRKWNNFIFWIHDVTARWGIGHTTVWFYDNLTWNLPPTWQLMGGKTNEQYMLEYELHIAQHQAQYYANLAYEYQWALLEAMNDTEESQLVYDEQTKTDKQTKDIHEG